MGKQKRLKQQKQNEATQAKTETSFINKHFLKIVFSILGLAAVFIAAILFLPSLFNPEKQEIHVNQEVYQYGKSLYEANCASCHGIEGAGNMQAQIPALDGSMHSWHHSDEWLINQIMHGGSNMPAVGSDLGWSQADVEAVLTYFKQWWTLQHKRVQPGSIGE